MSAEYLPAAPLDVSELLATLHRNDVDYTVIGGVAVQVHGHRRTTKDLDVVAEPSRANIGRRAAALAELRARPRDMPGAGLPTAEQLRAAPGVPPLTTDHGELQILRDVPARRVSRPTCPRIRHRLRRDRDRDRRAGRFHCDEAGARPTSAASRR